MTGIKHFNAEAFEEYAARLRMYGYNVTSPLEHDMEGGFNPYRWDGTEPTSETGFDLEAAMKWDLEQVRHADAVAVIPAPSINWKSKGLQTEIETAQYYGVPVYNLSPQILNSAMYKHTEGIFPCRKCDPLLLGKPFGQQAMRNFATGGYTGATYVNGSLGDAVKGKIAYVGDGRVLDTAGVAAKSGTIPAKGIAGEVRTTSSTGGQKGVKSARYDLIPTGALKQVAEHYGRGAEKYDDNQWRKGYEWSKSYAALQRHATEFWSGEDFDAETGSNHLAAVAWHALTLLTFYNEHPDFDDRFKS
jgi:hypothetical protein